MAISKSCLGCRQIFIARMDAKTCSPRCRKRLERNRRLIILELTGGGQSSNPHEPLRLLKSALRKIPRLDRAKALVFLVFLTLFSLYAPKAIAVSSGYITYDNGLKLGMAVSLSPSSTASQKVVQRANFTDWNQLLGMSEGINDSLVTAASKSSTVYVANSGQTNAYVSDVNGQIKKGDPLSLSPLAGILMKAGNTSQGLAGTALQDFPANYQTVEAKDAKGKAVSAKVAQLPININLILPATSTNTSTSWLEQIGRTVTGRNVSTFRVLSAIGIFGTLLVIEGVIIYSTITNSLVAIGRNPLASREVGIQVLRSLGVALVILLVGGSVISIILWL